MVHYSPNAVRLTFFLSHPNAAGATADQLNAWDATLFGRYEAGGNALIAELRRAGLADGAKSLVVTLAEMVGIQDPGAPVVSKLRGACAFAHAVWGPNGDSLGEDDPPPPFPPAAAPGAG